MTNEQKHEIEIPGLPEGWRAVSYRRAVEGVDHVLLETNLGEMYVQECEWYNNYNYIIVEKIQPREITLVETDEVRRPYYGEYFRYGLGDSPIEVCLTHNFEYAVRIWKIKEES